jgi:hypothetical protein
MFLSQWRSRSPMCVPGPARIPALLLMTCLLIGCDLPPSPSSVPAPGPAVSPQASVNVPSDGCPADVRIFGVVVERTPAGIRPLADAVVNGRFPPAPVEAALEKRTDTSGRYQFCREVPAEPCASGACRLTFEISAGKNGYATAVTTVTVDYNAWWFNDFGAPDLELTAK